MSDSNLFSQLMPSTDRSGVAATANVWMLANYLTATEFRGLL
jgi:hypothetical protein